MTVETRPIVVVTDDTTRAELGETLALLNADAMRISRRGKVGTLSAEYAVVHGRISAVLDDWLRAPA